MREILFRGKRKDNGKWVYGNYAVTDNNEKQHFIFQNKAFEFEVDPETVGQYTGITDDNEKKIFEGDIIKQINSYDKLEMTGFVRFSKSSQFVISHTYTEKENYYKREMKKAFAIKTNCEIIGNIYDNPELLEVE